MLDSLNLLKYLFLISLTKHVVCFSSSLRVPSRVRRSGGVPGAAWDELLPAALVSLGCSGLILDLDRVSGQGNAMQQ